MVVVGYGTNEDGEERERFWNDLDRIVDRVGNWYTIAIVRLGGVEFHLLPDDETRRYDGRRRERFSRTSMMMN